MVPPRWGWEEEKVKMSKIKGEEDAVALHAEN